MAAEDLIRVRPRAGDGEETRVSREWLERWPDDFEPVEEAPVGDDALPVEETTALDGGDQAAPAAPSTPSGGKKKEN